jgi:hypothetical protein
MLVSTSRADNTGGGGNPDKCWGAREKNYIFFLSFLHSLVIFSNLKFPPNCLWCAVIRTANFASDIFPQKLFQVLKFKIMKNESKKQRDFNSITIDINFTTNI